MGGAGKGDKGKGMGPRGKFAFKVLCPDTLVTCVLGRGGTYKDQLQEESQCKITLSNRDVFFPGTSYRILVVYGPTPEAVMMVLEKIIEKVVECGGQDQPGSSEYLGKERGEFIFRAAIAEKIFPGLMGSGGGNISAIRRECNAKVFIDNDRLQEHQLVRVIGEPDSITKAVQRINDYVQQHVEEDWFAEWSMIRSFDAQAARWEGARERSPRRGGGSWNGGGGGSWNGNKQSGPVDNFTRDMTALVNEFEPESLTWDHVITCDLPKQKVSALIGKRGEYSKKVRSETGTQVTFAPENEHGLQTLEIKGPLLSCYAAHALLMRRYHETEPAPEPEQPAVSAADTSKAQQIQMLQEQMAKLQAQLAKVSS